MLALRDRELTNLTSPNLTIFPYIYICPLSRPDLVWDRI